MKKPVLILIVVAIFVSIITSGMCGGPIDQIFSGWRDTSFCSTETGIFSLVPGEALTNYHRDGGAFFLIFVSLALLLLVGLFFGLLKTYSWLKKR